MEKWIGDILIDVSSPERAKFNSPLVLVHGLWMSSRCWRPWATHFSNLGWECWAMNLRGRYGEKIVDTLKRLTFDDCVDDLRQVIRAAEFPPVLLAYDLAGLMALGALQEEKASGLILLAPLPPKDVTPELPRALRLLRLKYRPLLFLRRPFRVDEKDFRKHWLGSLPESRHGEALDCLVVDSSRLIAEFFERRAKCDGRSISCPSLVVAGRDDPLAPAEELRDLATRLGADFRDYAGRGHWMIDESEEIVSDIHRWIIKKLGERIMLEEREESP
jgi:pimeloyl-ACP methyl ester carboxylesterase